MHARSLRLCRNGWQFDRGRQRDAGLAVSSIYTGRVQAGRPRVQANHFAGMVKGVGSGQGIGHMDAEIHGVTRVNVR